MSNTLQRSPEWEFDRAGKLTASNFAAAIGISPYKSRPELWREMTGKVEPFTGNAQTEWGEDHEDDAINAYEVRSGHLVLPSGFIVHPFHPWIGASPDGLVDDRGCIEAKCPSTQNLYGRVPEYYLPQIAGVLSVTQRDWCDFICWTPDGLEITRVTDRKYWDWMFPMLEEFWDYVKKDVEPPRLKRKPIYQSEAA